jgi:hypothetical protein
MTPDLVRDKIFHEFLHSHSSQEQSSTSINHGLPALERLGGVCKTTAGHDGLN